MTEPAEPLPAAEAVELIAAQSGVVALVGAPDVGKTTLALMAANAAARALRKVAILDTDLVQSEVGPPGTLGVVRLETPVASLAELRPRAMAFVGATSPVGHLLAVVEGTRRLVEHSLERGDDLVLLDTSGLVTGRLAEKLKLAKLSVVQPSLVLVVQRTAELERLATLISGYIPAPLVRVRASPEARPRSSVYRKARRALRLRKHFEAARVVDLNAGQVRTVDSWLYSGAPLPARQLKLASEALGTSVPHGELTPDGVYLCATGRPDRAGFVTLQEEFGRKRIWVTPALAFQSLMVGLVGQGGHLIDVGLLQGVNFERALLSILTPARSTAEAVQLHFGRLRVRPDGTEIAHLRPGDL